MDQLKQLFFGALMLLIVCGLTNATETEDQVDNTANVTVPAQINQDSLYQVINASYLPLKPMLQYSCFDCHSRGTDLPWYHSLPIIGGMMDDHIKDGLKNLDLSADFPFTGKENVTSLLKDIREEVEDGGMPILSYRLMHWGRLIEGEKRDSLFQWIDQSLEMLGETPSDDEMTEPEDDDD